MKKAKVDAATVYLICPDCDEAVESKKGSVTFDSTQLTNKEEVFCTFCNQWLKVPQIRLENQA